MQETQTTRKAEPVIIPGAEDQPTVDLVTVAAPAWGVHSPTVIYRMAANGEFPFTATKVGGKWRVATTDLRRSLGLSVSGGDAA